MINISKIFCALVFIGIVSCSESNMHPHLMNKKECIYISVRSYFHCHRYLVRNDSLQNELFEILNNAKSDFVKMPPRLVITIKGKKKDQSFFVCDDHIKDEEGKTYKCSKNIEKELYRITQGN